MKALQLRTSLTILFTGMLAVLVATLAFGYHALLVRQLDVDATTYLEEKARALHGYIHFEDRRPVLVYDGDDPEIADFIDDATNYYQVYDASDGRLLVQSPGLESLGLHYTPAEVAQFRDQAGPHDVQTDRGRLRLLSTLLTPKPGERYVVQVGDLLTSSDRTIAAFDRVLLWTVLGSMVLVAIVGRWLAGRALAPLTRLAEATHGIDVGQLHQRLAVGGSGDELDQVALAFNRTLERLERSVGEMRQFSAAMAHELRTPLAILRGEAELALRQSLSADDLRQRLASQIDEFDRLTRLINQILTIARAGAGEINMKHEPVDLGALATAVTEEIEPVAGAKTIRLTCDTADTVSVKGDAGWLERLLLILLDNAIKFTPEGGQVSVSVSRSGRSALLAVTDSGVGIAADALPRVFERFFRADAKSGHPQGAGLGLSLAKWIAEGHGATIGVTSKAGEGTSFAVRFPALPSNTERRTPKADSR